MYQAASSKILLEEIKDSMRECDRKLRTAESLNCQVSGENPFVISFVGRFKTGKSSLVNALLGMELLPTKATTATSVITRIVKGKNLRVWLREKNKETQITMEQAKDIILHYQVKNTKNPAEVVFEVPIAWLPPYVEIRDTPGMDDSSQEGALEEISLAAMRDTDLCVCVFDASCMIGEKEKERTKMLHRQLGGNLVYAVNCTNRLNSIERVNEIEALSKSFFGSMKYPGYGMGKFYMMCSAPGMIDLDGFDRWLKNMIAPDRMNACNALRKGAVQGQIQEVRNDIKTSAAGYIGCIDNEYMSVYREHKRIVEAAASQQKQKGINEANEIRNNLSAMEEVFANLGGLREKISMCTEGDGWVGLYSFRCGEITKEFFFIRFNEVRNQWGNCFTPNDNTFIRNAFDTLTFPEPVFTPIKATGGEKAGGTAVGAAFGFFFGGPIGAAIGGALGRMVGGADNGTQNDSVPTTMNYINNTVMPTLRRGFEATVSAAARRRQNAAAEESANVKSGLEDVLKNLQGMKEKLQKYCG